MLVATERQEQFFPETALPTSEWGCHKMLHDKFAPDHLPCILHTNPTEVIALSHTGLFQHQNKLNETLGSLLPEWELFLPAGIATAPYAKAGSVLLAELSARHIMDKNALIWPKHGLLVRAENPDKALDLTEVVTKAAALYLLSCGISRSLSSR